MNIGKDWIGRRLSAAAEEVAVPDAIQGVLGAQMMGGFGERLFSAGDLTRVADQLLASLDEPKQKP